jgi:hypothetical protein
MCCRCTPLCNRCRAEMPHARLRAVGKPNPFREERRQRRATASLDVVTDAAAAVGFRTSPQFKKQKRQRNFNRLIGDAHLGEASHPGPPHDPVRWIQTILRGLLLVSGFAASVGQSERTECRDELSWSAPGVAKDCAHGAHVIQRYLLDTKPAERRCASLPSCCRHFSEHRGAIGGDGTKFEDACPWSCRLCAKPGGAVPNADATPTVPPWDQNRERIGCDEWSDTDCSMCTDQHSRFVGAPCTWNKEEHTCEACIFCSANQIRDICPVDRNATE